MKRKQEGVSMVSLVITIIVIIILAAVAFSGSRETIGRSEFSGYTTDIDSVRTAFITEGVTSLIGEEETINNTVTKSQAYNYLAKGATTKRIKKEQRGHAWLSKSQASAIPCTRIEKEYAKDAIGIKLPKRKVNTYQATGVEVEYFVTNKGDIFTWPPFFRSDDGLFYVNDTISVAGSKVTSGDWIISGDDEAKMYEDGFKFMVNGVEIKLQGTGGDLPLLTPELTIEEIRVLPSVGYKDERNPKQPIGLETEFVYQDDGTSAGGSNGEGGGNVGNEDDDIIAECEHLETEVRNSSDTYTGDTYCKNCDTVLSVGEKFRPRIPEGGVYYVGVTADSTYTGYREYTYTAKYVAGDEFPQVVNNGDIYRYGEYEYRYNYRGIKPSTSSSHKWMAASDINGWGVRSISNYCGPVLESINGEPVTSLAYCFYRTSISDCSHLTIPNAVTEMHGAFYGCSSIRDLSTLVIPDSVTNLGLTFYQCTSLTTAPKIPDSVTNMSTTFRDCTSLITYVGSTDPDGDFSNYNISTATIHMSSTFSGCNKITAAPTIPNSVTNMSSTFSGCTSLVDISNITIPNSVTDMGSTFANCTSLVDASNITIPVSEPTPYGTFYGCSSLTDEGMPTLSYGITSLGGSWASYGTFYGCSSLTNLEDYYIPPTVTDIGFAFAECTSLVVAPKIIQCAALEDMYYTFKNCTSLVVSPSLPNSVEDMRGTFEGCTSLTDEGMPSIPHSIVWMDRAFYGCTSLINLGDYIVYDPSISSVSASYMFAECTSLVTAPSFNGFKLYNISGALSNCTSLTGTVSFNVTSNQPNYSNCFAGVDFEAQNITLDGTSTYIDGIGATGTNYCAGCNGKCKGGH